MPRSFNDTIRGVGFYISDILWKTEDAIKKEIDKVIVDLADQPPRFPQRLSEDWLSMIMYIAEYTEKHNYLFYNMEENGEYIIYIPDGFIKYYSDPYGHETFRFKNADECKEYIYKCLKPFINANKMIFNQCLQHIITDAY